MARSHQVAELLLKGNTLERISNKLGISYSSVLGYARRAAHDGLIRQSDLLLAVPREEREAILESTSGAFLGELYGQLWDIETGLHAFTRRKLEEAYGGGEDGWWAEGVPADVRKKCVDRREDDPDRLEPYCYTDLIDMWKVIDKQWKVFEREFTKRKRDKRALGDDLRRLNQIRNSVMHPAKRRIPADHDFVFVRDFHAVIKKITD